MKYRLDSFSELHENVYTYFPKGTFDSIFLLVSEFIYRIFDSGLTIDNINNVSDPVGSIMIDDSNYCHMFKTFYHCCSTGMIPEFTKFYLDFELQNFICKNKDITEEELAKSILMKQLLTYILYGLEKSTQLVSDLAREFCSLAANQEVQTNLSKVNEKIDFYNNQNEIYKGEKVIFHEK